MAKDEPDHDKPHSSPAENEGSDEFIVRATDLEEADELESKPIRVPSRDESQRDRDDEKTEPLRGHGDEPGFAGSRFSLRTIVQAALGLIALGHAVIGPALLFATPFFFGLLGLGELRFDGYAQLLGLASAIFAVMLAMVALKPKARRALIWYPLTAVLGTAIILGGHWFGGTENMPLMLKLFFLSEAGAALLLILITVRLYLPGEIETVED